MTTPANVNANKFVEYILITNAPHTELFDYFTQFNIKYAIGALFAPKPGHPNSLAIPGSEGISLYSVSLRERDMIGVPIYQSELFINPDAAVPHQPGLLDHLRTNGFYVQVTHDHSRQRLADLINSTALLLIEAEEETPYGLMDSLLEEVTDPVVSERIRELNEIDDNAFEDEEYEDD